MAPLAAAALTGVLALTAKVCSAFPSKIDNMLRESDPTGDGGCLNGEQYMQIETVNTLEENYDYYTLTWRQVSDACGDPISGSEAAVFSGKFTQGEVKRDGKGRDQLLLFVCCPYGYYELDIEIVGGDSKECKTGGALHWEVELGPSEEHIWDTWNVDKYNTNPDFTPCGPGDYTYPREGEDDPHMALMWSGPEPGMKNCESYIK